MRTITTIGFAGWLILSLSTPLHSKEVYTPDIDLEKTPKDYRQRVVRFRNLLRKEPDRSRKISRALTLAKDLKSEFRRDAVSFLGEVRASEAVPELITLSSDRDVRDEVIFSLGEISDVRAMPTLIRALSDMGENVRGNAQLSLQKITKVPFNYRYDDSPAKRKTDIVEVESWWKREKANFKPRDLTAEELKSAEEAWEKYGRAYLQDLSR